MAIMANCILTEDYAPKAKDRGDTVLCFHYGQSNSGLAPSGPVIDVRTRWDHKVLTFDDVFRETVGGTRGFLGHPPVTKAERLIPARDEATGVQSIVRATGQAFLQRCEGVRPDVLVRTAGIGGQGSVDKNGIHRYADNGEKSHVYVNLIAAIQHGAALSEARGRPASKIFIAFSHGENDRTMSGAAYEEHLLALMADIEADLSELDLPIHWFLDQPAGTGAPGTGNNWPNRLAVRALCDRRIDCTFVGPRYQFPFYTHDDGFQDPIHTSSLGKVLLGEVFGSAMAAVDRGDEWKPVAVTSAQRDAEQIMLQFSGPVTLVPEILPRQPEEVGILHGFYAPRTRVTRVSLSGPDRVLVETEDPAREICYAFRGSDKIIRNGTVDHVDAYALGRGDLVEADPFDSLLLPGRVQHKFVAGFQVIFDADGRPRTG